MSMYGETRENRVVSPDPRSRSIEPAVERESGSGLAARSRQQLGRCVADYPTASVLAGFAGGLGIGLAIGWLLGGEPSRQSSRWAGADMAERIGRSVRDAVAGVVPSASKSD